ncbi:type II secretion system F family protein [Geomicrobium sp. JSM 1781026]|uniref:type II secretion system F family protein n=1 Tax=Geomicrobium sp. JSM 1781026 TaxID=3344580 RepID=UPI0035BEFD31
MFLTYLFILVCLFILIRAVIELSQIIVYGTVPKKQVLTRAFERLEGKKRSVYSVEKRRKDPFNTNTVKYIQAALVSLVMFLIGFIVLRSTVFAFMIALLGLLYPRLKTKRDERKRNDLMLMQFREAILSLASSLKAGSSLQIAFKRCERDMARELQLQKDKPMLDALEKINRDVQLGTPIEQVLIDFKNSYPIEDLNQFVDAIIMTRSKGGNLADVIQNTAVSISDKIMIHQEIKLATTQKKMEANILTFMPVMLLVVLLVLNPDYMQPMYETTFGTLLLFLAVLMLIVNFFIGRKITHIDV